MSARFQNPMVLTPCARNGIFRYFDTGITETYFKLQPPATTPTIAVVDGVGNPAQAGNKSGRQRVHRHSPVRERIRSPAELHPPKQTVPMR